MEARRRRPVPPALAVKDSAVEGSSAASPSPTSPKSLPPALSGIRAITATWSPVFSRKSGRSPKPPLSSPTHRAPPALNRSVSSVMPDVSSNRHSLATISDFLGRGSADRGYTLPAFRGFSNLGTDSSVKNELLDSVQTAIVQLFQKKRLATELHILQENVRRLTKTDSAPPVYEYFKEKLLRKGMVILRESMKNQTGASLLEKLGQQWNHFYTVILPLLQAILYPLPQMDLPIRETCLVEFRDTVVLKINLVESLEFPDVEVSPLIEQMLLVLQSVRDSDPPNKNYLRLEKMVAKVVVPYLGHRGLYEGHSEPEIASLFEPAGKEKDTDAPQDLGRAEDVGTSASKSCSLSLPRQVVFTRQNHPRQNSAVSGNLTLPPVVENDFMRRHSIALEQVS